MTRPVKVILLGIDPDHYAVACQAVRMELARTDGGKSSIRVFRDGDERDKEYALHVKRNKSSITVRKC